MSNGEHFRDVQNEISRKGVLGGEAWDNQEQIKESLSPDNQGYDFVCHCDHCGKKLCITVPWVELVMASCGVTPVDTQNNQPWAFVNGFFYPPILCGCREAVFIPITPASANRMLGTGVKANILSQQAVAQKQAEILQRSQQGRR